MGGDGAEAPGHLARHHLEEGVAVGRGERVGVAPVDLELGVGVLVVGGVGLPAELLQVTDQAPEVAHVGRQALEVVAGLRHGVDAVGVKRGDRAIRFSLDQEVLGLHPHHHHVSRAPEFSHRPPSGPRRPSAVSSERTILPTGPAPSGRLSKNPTMPHMDILPRARDLFASLSVGSRLSRVFSGRNKMT